MDIMRRVLVVGGALALASPPASQAREDLGMYGLIGQMLAAPGERDQLIAILGDGTTEMPGCRSYVVAKDPTNPDAIWITEVWDSQAQHQASLKLPAVQAAIAKARPIIAGFGHRFETQPVTGVGL